MPRLASVVTVASVHQPIEAAPRHAAKQVRGLSCQLRGSFYHYGVPATTERYFTTTNRDAMPLLSAILCLANFMGEEYRFAGEGIAKNGRAPLRLHEVRATIAIKLSLGIETAPRAAITLRNID